MNLIVNKLGKTSRKAFTLVELLVVISIIALLLAIMLPALNRARESGRSVVCRTHQKNVGMAFYMYDASHGRLPPWGVHPDTGGFDPALQWYAAILPYLTAKAKEVGVTSADIYVCPTRKAKYKNVGVSIAGKVAAIEHVDYGVNYGVNVGMFNTVLPSNGSVDPRWMVPPPGGYLGVQSVKISDIRVPSQVFTMMDARVLTYAEGAGPWAGTSIILPEIDAPWAPGSRNSDKSLFTLDYDADEDGLNDSSSVLIMPARYEPPGGIYNNSDHERHGKGPNVLFSDGSVKHVTTKDWLQKCHWLW